MNKAQKRIIIIALFVLGGLLICGAWIGTIIITPQGGTEIIPLSYLLRDSSYEHAQISFFFKDIKLYLGIISICAGFFFLKMRVKDE